MRKFLRFFIPTVVFCAAALAGGALNSAQAAEKVWRIGFLSLTPTDSFHETFFKALRRLGYVEGRNLSVASRHAAANEKRLGDYAVELTKLGVDVIVARGTQATLAAKTATRTIPIVMTGSSDPVGTGLVATLARPGGNVTGMSILAPDLAQKRLELLSRIVPASRVAVLWNPTNAGNGKEWEQSRAAAKTLNMTLLPREVRQPKDLHRAFTSLPADRIEALVTLTDAILTSSRTEIVQYTANYRLPGMFHLKDFVEQGGLMSYGPNLHHSFERAAYYVDRIFKGARPAELPVEQPMKFELVINRQTAREIGIKVPDDFLRLADKVIR